MVNVFAHIDRYVCRHTKCNNNNRQQAIYVKISCANPIKYNYKWNKQDRVNIVYSMFALTLNFMKITLTEWNSAHKSMWPNVSMKTIFASLLYSPTLFLFLSLALSPALSNTFMDTHARRSFHSISSIIHSYLLSIAVVRDSAVYNFVSTNLAKLGCIRRTIRVTIRVCVPVCVYTNNEFITKKNNGFQKLVLFT